MALLSAENLTLYYERVAALQAVSFTVSQGDYLCIVGENGSGKSSLMKAILGLVPISSGTLQLGDGLRRTQIGYLPQQAPTQRDFPAVVEEIVLSGCLNRMGMRPYYTAKEKLRTQTALDRLGIASLRGRSYHELSGGQQQRVLLARALCAADRLLLLDEPAAGLDPLATQELYQVIASLNRQEGMTIVMVSHDIPSSIHYASHILHLRNRTLFFGRTESYRNSEVARQFLQEAAHD